MLRVWKKGALIPRWGTFLQALLVTMDLAPYMVSPAPSRGGGLRVQTGGSPGFERAALGKPTTWHSIG